MPLKAFLDTMIFLHFRRMDEIDFCKLLNVDSVTLVISRITIRELDKQKDTNTNQATRDRSRLALKQIYQLLQGDKVVRANVQIESTSLMATEQELKNLGLVALWNDDQLIGTIVKYKEQNPEHEVLLITDDVGPQLKCADLGIRVASLPDNYRLPDQVDEQTKENRRLKAELDRIKNALPNLRAEFGAKVAGKTVKKITLPFPRTLDSKFVENEIAQLREKYPPQYPDPNRKLTEIETALAASGKNIHQIDEAQFIEYNKKLEQYFQDYEAYLVQDYEALLAEQRTIKFQIRIVNDGTSPAKDVDIHLHFPDGFVLGKSNTVELPVSPSLPSLPRSRFQEQVDQLSQINFADFGPQPFKMPDMTTLRIKKTNSYDISDCVGQLKHNYAFTLPTLYLTFDSWESAASFHCDYRLHAANVVDPFSGELHFHVTKEEI